MRPLGRTLVAMFAGMDLMFKVLVGLAFLQVTGGNDPAQRAHVLEWTLYIAGPAWVAWIVAMALLVRPIDIFIREEKTGGATVEQLQRAGVAVVRLPSRLALLWSVYWCGSFTAVGIIVGTAPSNFALACLLVALALGPYPLAHGLAVWLSAPAKRGIDLVAHRALVKLSIPRVTIRNRLIVYGFCIAVAPSAYMAAIGVSARMQLASYDTMFVAIMVGFLAVALFAILTTLLVSSALTRPVVDLTDVVRNIAREGGEQLGRIPQQMRDELGVLVELTNDMIDRLERTEHEREAALANLEEMNRTLEDKVNEGIEQVLEARATLEQEKAERSKVAHELAVARRIQTSILPREWKVEGLDIAAVMVTATDVGGDYYDILPRPFGGWIGIGDVSGHGVHAGLIMMMLQSITATVVDTKPDGSTRELVVAIDRILTHNIRRRLGSNDFVTFTLMRYDRSGRVRFAGAHEDIILWRAKTGRCELVDTPGPWVGVSGKLEAVTVENELQLGDGDLMVLYTDGIIEAKGSQHRRYGLDRLCATIERLARHSQSVDQISAQVIESVQEWCVKQEDDMSILVARRKPVA